MSWTMSDPARWLMTSTIKESSPRDLESWLRESHDDPLLLEAAGQVMLSVGRAEEGAEWLRKAIAKAPAPALHLKLAEAYESLGRPDDAIRTLVEALDLPDAGLAHAQVRVRIANIYMQRGDFEKAEPFAAAGAESYAAWAIQCLIRCEEGLKRWDEAERWLIRLIERYPNHAPEYWAFCVRTGHGDRKRAGELIGRGPEQGDEPATLRARAEMALLEGDVKTAAPLFQRVFDGDPRAFADGILALVLADGLGDGARRDAAIAKVIQGDPTAPGSKILGAIREALSKPDPLGVSLPEIDGQLALMSPTGQSSLAFVTGMFLRQHGRAVEATRYLKRVAETEAVYPPFRAYARRLLGTE